MHTPLPSTHQVLASPPDHIPEIQIATRTRIAIQLAMFV